METIQPAEQFHTIVPDSNPRDKVIAAIGIGVIIVVAIGVYFYVRFHPTNAPVHITQAEINAFNKQVASEPSPAFTTKQITAFNKQVASSPSPSFTQAEIDAFNKQVASEPAPVIDSK